MEIKPADSRKLFQVVELARRCHPDRVSPRGVMHYFVYPTIVAEEDHQYLGYAGMSIALAPVPTMFGVDVGVHPSHRGKGIGRALVVRRCAIAKELGLQSFIGATEPTNAPMIKIFEDIGLHACQDAPGYYREFDPPRDAMIYSGAIGHLKLDVEM